MISFVEECDNHRNLCASIIRTTIDNIKYTQCYSQWGYRRLNDFLFALRIITSLALIERSTSSTE